MGHRIRLLSANLLNGRADPESLAGLVESRAVDVVAVQELSPNQAETLAEILPHGLLQPAEDHTGIGLALRHQAQVKAMSLPGRRRAHLVDLEPDSWPDLSVTVEVINTHITAPHIFPWWRTVKERRGQVDQLERHFQSRPEKPRALVGDLNSTPLWPLYRRLTRRFTDAASLAASRRGESPARTWGPWPGAPRLLRIDHALVAEVGIEAFDVCPLPGSDHSAVVVDLVPGS